jgi:hypothetical protein
MPLKSAMNTYMVYQFIRELTRSWDEMKAYELGIIDSEGNQLKRSKDLKTQEERESYTLWHRLIWNVKRILEKLPGGASKIKSYAAAAWLLKENKDLIDNQLIRVVELNEVSEARMMLEEVTKTVQEESPTNVSAGVAQKDMPLLKKKKKKSEEECMDNSIESLRKKIEEGREVKRVVRGGKVRKKLSCPAGQINKGGKCVPATSKDKQRFIKAAKKRKRSIAGKSLVGAMRRRSKSLRKRSSSGLK